MVSASCSARCSARPGSTTRRPRDCSRHPRGARSRPIRNSRAACPRPCAPRAHCLPRHPAAVPIPPVARARPGVAVLPPIGERRLAARTIALRDRGSDVGGLAVALAAALEQRIALQLGLDIAGEIEIGQLQQLDGLHQLRRHHQRLALPELESLGKRHNACSTGPNLAYPVRVPVYTSSPGLWLNRAAGSRQTVKSGTLRRDRGALLRDRSRYRPDCPRSGPRPT